MSRSTKQPKQIISIVLVMQEQETCIEKNIEWIWKIKSSSKKSKEQFN